MTNFIAPPSPPKGAIKLKLTILMVSPPKESLAERKTHPGAGQDPFKVPLAPEFE